MIRKVALPFSLALAAVLLFVLLSISNEEVDSVSDTEHSGFSTGSGVPVPSELQLVESILSEPEHQPSVPVTEADVYEEVLEPVPEHLSDRFTREEYAAWKKKRRDAEGGPALSRTIDDIPESIFRDQLLALSDEGREEALLTFNRNRVPLSDVPSLRITNENGVLTYACGPGCTHAHHQHDEKEYKPLPIRMLAEESLSATSAASTANQTRERAAMVSVSAPPAFNSKPGAPFTIYLDFNGGKVTGTEWNRDDGVPEWDFAAWSTDGDTETFSNEEQAIIFGVWQRVSEHFAPFNLNVSTDVSFDRDNNSQLSNSVGWVLFASEEDRNGNQQPAYTSSGIAFLDVVADRGFARRYQPAWVNTDGVSPRDDFLASIASHEFGHNLGLSHDGENGGDGEYYDGHGSGDQSWGPIMGTGGYYSNTAQWTKGEYQNATQNEDDLAIIETSLEAHTGFNSGYRDDDHGDSISSATSVHLNELGEFVRPQTTHIAGDETAANEGVIERNTDIDFWSFRAAVGNITLRATPYIATENLNGHNLDILMVLHDQNGTVLATADPSHISSAVINYEITTPGLYYFSVMGTGWGIPMGGPNGPTGWTEYGSIGQYFLDLDFTSVEDNSPEVSVDYNEVNIGDGDVTPSTTQGTDFGTVNEGQDTVIRTFRVRNSGQSVLTLDSLNSSNPAFSVGELTPSLSSGESTSFTVTFSPTVSGEATATISFETNDDNEALFDFAVRGIGGDSLSDDHGDSIESATSIEPNSTSSGVLTSGDQDYFRIEVSSGGTLTLSSAGSTDTYGVLLDASGQQIEENDDGGNSLNFNLSYSVSESGTYFVIVRGYSDSSVGAYDLISSFEGDDSNPVLELAGWVYYAWPYAYVFDSGRWYFFNVGDQQFRVNLQDGQWGVLSDATGWHFYTWPYGYSIDRQTWHWYNNDLQWVVDLVTGDWATLGDTGE